MPVAPVSTVHSDAEIMNERLVFAGTPVPFQVFLDYLHVGQALSDFLNDSPTVSEAQTRAALEQANDIRLTRAHPYSVVPFAAPDVRVGWASRGNRTGCQPLESPSSC